PKSIQVAVDMLRQGRHETALVIYCQLSSIFLRREFLNAQKVNLENLVLRWFLSDGAGALVLSSKGGDHPILVDAYVESMGLGRAPGETMALGVEAGMALAHESSPFLLNVHAQGLHHLWQDVAALGRLGDELTLTGLKHMLERTGVHPGDVT